MYEYTGSVTHTMVDHNTVATIDGETVTAMSVLKRFDNSNRVGTDMDAQPATEARKNLLRALLRETLANGKRRHARKLQGHFNGLRAEGAIIPALQVDAAILYLNY